MKTWIRPSRKIAALAASHDRGSRTQAEPAAKQAMPAPDAAKAKMRSRLDAATVSWYGSLLIISTLFIAAGWELFRLILAIVALD